MATFVFVKTEEYETVDSKEECVEEEDPLRITSPCKTGICYFNNRTS